MFEFLSYGGGVNSTAVVLLDKPNHIIFADTGDEHPDTYRYIEEVTKPFVRGYGGSFVTVRNHKYPRLQDQAMKEKIIPVRMSRWCTDKFKIRPIRRYLKENDLLPAAQLIGIDAGEAHRAKESGHKQFHNRFPLIERGLDRDDCVDVIRKAELPVPRKSGCFYCPFQPKGQWIALRKEHKELFQIAVDMEKNGSNYGKLFLAGDRPLDDWLQSGRIRRVSDDQLELNMPCSCYDG
jgi:3'-phosphoadenosine 5'-phosphosulfate sulfotransferase (PAPS reductase)/FAD synthetase